MSRAHRPDAAPAAPPANQRRRAPAAGQAAGPAAAPALAAFEEEMPFSFAEISSLAVPKLERIPFDAQIVVAAQLAKALQSAAVGSVTGWLRLHSFATLILSRTQRGGKKKVAAALRRRCHLWAHGRFSELWTEAREIASSRGRAAEPQARFLVMDEEDEQIGRFVGLATDVDDACQLDPKTVQQVIRKTKARWFGKAVATLAAAKVSPVNAESLRVMRDKHPQAPEPPLPRIPPQADTEITVSWGNVIKTLRALPRGTAPGPSGLSAQHLLDLVSPASPIKAPLVAVIRRIATGSIPEEARPHGYGARLVALEKKDGGLRPIACGEVLRRVAAKILARDKSVVQAIKPILARCGQTGVGMKSGADAMACAMRCVGERYRHSGQGRGIVKVDLRNAFNNVNRGAILKAVAESTPGLLPYAIAAYGHRSQLSFGHEVVWSECGVQQGDPLGPLFFCLVLEQVLREMDLSLAGHLPPLGADDIPPGAPIPAQLDRAPDPQPQPQPQPQQAGGEEEPAPFPQQGMVVDGEGAPIPPAQAQLDPLRASQLEARAFYLDDGAAAGLWRYLVAWLAAFEREGGAVGMHLNHGKSEVICLEGEEVPDAFAAMTRRSLDSWDILGAPCGSAAAVKEAVEKILDRAERRARAIASLPDPHVAMALLNSCAGFVCVVSLMRATGPTADYGRVDTFMRRAVGKTLGAELSDLEWLQTSLPLRLGGLGMHSCADTAAVAGAAATLEGMKGLPLLTRSPEGGPHTITPTQDSVCAASLSCPRLALFPEVLTEVRDSLQAGAASVPRKQREWAVKISAARQESLLRNPLTGVRGQARVRSCAAKHASTWLYGALRTTCGCPEPS
ncbi:SLACS reverse transcriptase [Diplonema papillatum]|nr:SLACS reverse transcriptase [Diplonema papillatum]